MSKVKASGSRKFYSITCRVTEYHTTALIFESGKVVIVGAKSYVLVHKTARYLFRKLDGEGRMRLNISNFVACGDLNREVNLPFLCQTINKLKYAECSLEPELFNGLIITTRNGPKVIMFHSGKFNVTGCKKEKEVRATYNHLKYLLDEFYVHCYLV